jgi:hypothetical protein
MKRIIQFALIFCCLSAAAAPVIQPDGSFKYDHLRAQLAWFDGEWRMTGQNRESIRPSSGYPVVQTELFELDGVMKLNHSAGSLKLQETIRLRPSRMHYSAVLKGAGKMPCRNAVLILSLPVAAFGGKHLFADNQRITLSAEDAKANYPELSGVKKPDDPSFGRFLHDHFRQSERLHSG